MLIIPRRFGYVRVGRRGLEPGTSAVVSPNAALNNFPGSRLRGELQPVLSGSQTSAQAEIGEHLLVVGAQRSRVRGIGGSVR
jgi:hypothetical protein